MVAVEHVLDLENAGNFDPIFEEKSSGFFLHLLDCPLTVKRRCIASSLQGFP